jgi:pimeloyl-ACP methyl ester carboxylesterase
VFLALEFVALRFVSRNDPSPRPTWLQLARAWLGETLQAPRVFCWRQPFRWRAVPDRIAPAAELQGRRGVVFIPGFVCNRGFWTPWLKLLNTKGHAFVAVNLEPVFGSIDDYVPVIDEAVSAVTAASGVAPILVCHSMGGLAARAWLRTAGAPQRVHHVVTIGAPHGGTWLGSFSRLRNGSQMALGSEWLRKLEADSASQPQVPFTCWYSNCDNVVFPASTATLPGADNRFVAGVAHVDLAFRDAVISPTLQLLDRL